VLGSESSPVPSPAISQNVFTVRDSDDALSRAPCPTAATTTSVPTHDLPGDRHTCDAYRHGPGKVLYEPTWDPLHLRCLLPQPAEDHPLRPCPTWSV
jgi:hypothetical protein